MIKLNSSSVSLFSLRFVPFCVFDNAESIECWIWQTFRKVESYYDAAVSLRLTTYSHYVTRVFCNYIGFLQFISMTSGSSEIHLRRERKKLQQQQRGLTATTTFCVRTQKRVSCHSVALGVTLFCSL